MSGEPPRTALVVFAAAAEVDAALLTLLRRLCSTIAASPSELSRMASSPRVARLAPTPAAPCHALLARARAAFPERPPSGDAALEPIPRGAAGVAEEPAQLAGMVRCEAGGAVSLLEEQADAAWPPRAGIPLGGTG